MQFRRQDRNWRRGDRIGGNRTYAPEDFAEDAPNEEPASGEDSSSLQSSDSDDDEVIRKVTTMLDHMSNKSVADLEAEIKSLKQERNLAWKE